MLLLFILVSIGISIESVLSGYIEKVTVSGCESCQLMLTCRRLDSIIAILDVDFKAKTSVFDTGLVTNQTMPFPPDHPRDALNRRCSGLNHCSFVLVEDSYGSEAYGAGNITVKYACATRDKVYPYCNTEIRLTKNFSSGLIHNPGYPRFYAGQHKCVWKIKAPLYQKLRLRILDVALFDTRVLSQEECKDTLEVRDSGLTIFTTCNQEHPPSEVTSATESVEIVLTSRQPINPRRGILIYYTSLECPVPLPPRNGFLIFHNETIASFVCCQGYVFPETQSQNKTIFCVDASWDTSLPLLDCQKPENSSPIVLQEAIPRKTDEMALELLAPILLMVILFALNGVVIFYIHRARKNQIEEPRDEELGVFTPTRER